MMSSILVYLLSVIACHCSAHSQNVERLNQQYRISMVSSELRPAKPAVFLHGESPVWDAASQCLYFVDVPAQDVHRLSYTTGKIETKHIGYGQVNVISLVSGSHRLLVGVRSELYLLDWSIIGDSALRLLTVLDLGQPLNVINEGKPDFMGRFWVGTKGPQTGDDVLPDRATLYRVDPDNIAQPQIQIRPVSISNGLTWALNNTVFYYVDSPTQKVEAFDFDPVRGEISARRTIIDISNYGYEDAIPDGMTIDSEGHLWVALMFGGAVLHINPDSRQVIFGYKIPVARVTSVCWGGPNLDELFVTTGRDPADSAGSGPEPLAGAVFTIRNTGSKGVKPYQFRFNNADSY